MSVQRGLWTVATLAFVTGGAAIAAEPHRTAATGTIAFHHETSLSGETSGPFIDDIYTVGADGTRLRNLTRNGGRVHDSSPAWSPDGARIAFVRRYDGTRDAVFVMNADGTGARLVTRYPGGRQLVALSWSPDGKRIAFVRNESIWVVNADGTALRVLIQNAGEPAWSPSGSKIAFVRALRDDDGSSTEIFVANGNGTGQRRLTRNARWDGSPQWSPDGRWIAFHQDPGLFVMSQSGTAVRRLARGDWPFCLSWSPDGGSIAFCRSGGIAVVDTRGGRPRTIFRGPIGGVWSVSWSPIG